MKTLNLSDKFSLIERALAIALDAHAGQTDKGGYPYIMHCIAVASPFGAEDMVAAALLHDVVEDSDWTLVDLVNNGIPLGVVAMVDALTRRAGESYKQYIRRCRADGLAAHIKIADIKHNLDRDRVGDPLVRAEMEKTRAMYYDALGMLDVRIER